MRQQEVFCYRSGRQCLTEVSKLRLSTNTTPYGKLKLSQYEGDVDHFSLIGLQLPLPHIETAKQAAKGPTHDVHPAPALPHDLHLNPWPETNHATLMEPETHHYWLASCM
jgi:hypothetical protein